MKDSAWKLFLKLIVDQSAGYRVVISKQPADETMQIITQGTGSFVSLGVTFTLFLTCGKIMEIRKERPEGLCSAV